MLEFCQLCDFEVHADEPVPRKNPNEDELEFQKAGVRTMSSRALSDIIESMGEKNDGAVS